MDDTCWAVVVLPCHFLTYTLLLSLLLRLVKSTFFHTGYHYIFPGIFCEATCVIPVLLSAWVCSFKQKVTKRRMMKKRRGKNIIILNASKIGCKQNSTSHHPFLRSSFFLFFFSMTFSLLHCYVRSLKKQSVLHEARKNKKKQPHSFPIFSAVHHLISAGFFSR